MKRKEVVVKALSGLARCRIGAQKIMKLPNFVTLYLTNSSEKSFSLVYNEIARKFFIALAFAGGLSASLFGIPLIPTYFITHSTNIFFVIFSFFSILGCIWGIMAYREFTTSGERVLRAREIAHELDPMIGNMITNHIIQKHMILKKVTSLLAQLIFGIRRRTLPAGLTKENIGMSYLVFRLPERRLCFRFLVTVIFHWTVAGRMWP